MDAKAYVQIAHKLKAWRVQGKRLVKFLEETFTLAKQVIEDKTSRRSSLYTRPLVQLEVKFLTSG